MTTEQEKEEETKNCELCGDPWPARLIHINGWCPDCRTEKT